MNNDRMIAALVIFAIIFIVARLGTFYVELTRDLPPCEEEVSVSPPTGGAWVIPPGGVIRPPTIDTDYTGSKAGVFFINETTQPITRVALHVGHRNGEIFYTQEAGCGPNTPHGIVQCWFPILPRLGTPEVTITHIHH